VVLANGTSVLAEANDFPEGQLIKNIATKHSWQTVNKNTTN
jgi:hypothetical protein